MIIVTGATGTLGALVVEELLARRPADQIGVSVRDPDKARALADRGVRVRSGDFDDPASLAHAFEGATELLVISASAVGEVARRRHRTAFDAARAAGAQRILYTSHMGANPASPFPPMPAHAQSEAMLSALGVPFVSLRNGFYASSALMLLGQAVQTGKLIAPEDGPVSWTSHADLAAAAAIVLTEPAKSSGLTPPLTAREAFDLADIARLASELTGVPIERVVVSDEAHRETLRSYQMPAERADLLVGMFRASRRGEFAAVDPTLGQLLGRPPQALRDLLRRHLQA